MVEKDVQLDMWLEIALTVWGIGSIFAPGFSRQLSLWRTKVNKLSLCNEGERERL